MELYGIAVAVVPKKGAGHTRRIVCTPVAVSSDNRDTFRILDDLKFTMEFTSINDLAHCFVKLVDTADKVVTMQKGSCKKNKVKYRPVALLMGQDSKNPAGLDKIYRGLFGESFTEYWGKNFASSLEDIAERDKFVDASCRMAQVIKLCTLMDGNFGGPRPGSIKEWLQSDKDKELISLKEKIDAGRDTDSSAHKRIMEIAREEGQENGRLLNNDYKLFKVAVPKDYFLDKEKKIISEEAKKIAHYAYYDWHPDYRKAFYEGVSDVYRGERVRRIKLPTDPDMPFFTDPVADAVREQLEIAQGQRARDAVEDLTKEREKIAHTGERVVEDAKHVKGEDPDLPAHLVEFYAKGPFEIRSGLKAAQTRKSPEEFRRLIHTARARALVDTMAKIEKDIDDPNFIPSDRQKQLILNLATEFDAPNPETAGFHENCTYLKKFVDEWKAKDTQPNRWNQLP